MITKTKKEISPWNFLINLLYHSGISFSIDQEQKENNNIWRFADLVLEKISKGPFSEEIVPYSVDQRSLENIMDGRLYSRVECKTLILERDKVDINEINKHYGKKISDYLATTIKEAYIDLQKEQIARLKK